MTQGGELCLVGVSPYAAEWRPSRNTGWFAAKVVGVKQKYGLSVNPAERAALASMLASDSSRTVNCN